MRAEGPGQSALLMVDVAQALIADEINYAVIGAMAAAVHGVARASLDADAIVPLRIQEARGLAQELEADGFSTELRTGDADDPKPALLVIKDRHGNRVDLLIGLRGLDVGLFARASRVVFSGAELRFASREDFIAMKAFAGGPLDLDDARRAMAVDRGSLDVVLLRRLAGQFGAAAGETMEALLQATE